MKTTRDKTFFSDLLKEIASFEERAEIEEIGHIVEVGDGIAQVDKLKDAALGELLLFPKNTTGLVFNLEEGLIGAIILGDFSHLKEGDEVKMTGRILEIPVGEGLLGRVVNPLSQSLDGKGALRLEKFLPFEKIAPGVIYRQPVDTPLQTGLMSIDSMIPIGRGQRELIIGDRETGKTAITLDTIINQKDKGVICIYVAIGQKASKVMQIVKTFEKYEALKYTIVVVASASDPASLQYLAPYAGCAMGEYFMGQGKDVLIVYDDLTKHAWAYRQISLLLKRPSGREAYPGDVFYLHSRLLERACRLSDKQGGGSLTALPIIETQAGDISAFIPTNVISITDGQIYLEPDLFYAGIRPAINIGLSVSRVGGKAQIKAMKQVAGKLRLDLSQYRELSAFAQFGSELDENTRKQLERGKRLTELLKQAQYQPLPVEEQVILIWIATNGFLDDIEPEKIKEFKEKFPEFIRNNYADLGVKIAQEKKISLEVEEKLKKAILEFKPKKEVEEEVKEKEEQKEDLKAKAIKREGGAKWLPLETSKEE